MAKRKSGTLKALLTKVKKTGQSKEPALAKKWAALKFTVREDANGDSYVLKKIFQQNVYHRTYRKNSPLWSDRGFEGRRVLDLGANIGAFSRRAMEEGAEVVAVEMDRANFSLLKRNTARTALSRKSAAAATRIHAAVVAESSGKRQIFTKAAGRAARGNPNRNSLLQDDVNPDRLAGGGVPSVALRRLLGAHGPFHLVKIDIEGYEVELFSKLAGQKRLFDKCEVLVYFHVDKFPTVAVFAAFLRRLRQLFKVVRLETGIVGPAGMLDAAWETDLKTCPGLRFRRLPGMAGKKKDILIYCGHDA